MKNQQARSIEPDFVRGVAILLAMGWHLNGVSSSSQIVTWMLTPGRTLGWAGVDLFFVLSGYLIGTLIFTEFRRTGDFAGGRFLARRALKIWPVFYLFLAFGVVTQFKPWREWLLQNAFHVQNFFGSPIGHLWSLAVEEHFYLVFALAFVAWGRSPKAMRRVPLVLSLIMGLALALRCSSVLAGISAHALQTLTFFRVDSLAAGVMLAYLKLTNPERYAALASRKGILAGVCVVGVAILASLDAHGPLICSIGYTLAYVTAAAFLLLCQGNSLILRGSLAVRVLAWIGLYSYALYIWHVVMIRVSGMVMAHLHLHDSTGAIELTIRYGGAIGLAVAVTKLVEIPFLKVRDRMFPAVVGLSASAALVPPTVTLERERSGAV